jgi:copper chaperone CopZ
MKRELKTIITTLITLSLTNISTFADEGKIWVAEVLGMSCPLCAKNIERQLKRGGDVVSVSIDLGTGNVIIEYKNKKNDLKVPIKRAIESAGFTVKDVYLWKEKN